MFLQINTGLGDPKGFADNMKAQKRWILKELDKFTAGNETNAENIEAWEALNGLLNFLDEVGDCLFDQSDLTEKEVFDMPDEEEC